MCHKSDGNAGISWEGFSDSSIVSIKKTKATYKGLQQQSAHVLIVDTFCHNQGSYLQKPTKNWQDLLRLYVITISTKHITMQNQRQNKEKIDSHTDKNNKKTNSQTLLVYKVIGWLQKTSIFPHRRGSLEVPRRGPVLKAKKIKESTSLNWNFQRGGGLKQKTLRGGSMDIFWNNIF